MRICRSGRTRHFDSRYHGIAPRIVGNPVVTFGGTIHLDVESTRLMARRVPNFRNGAKGLESAKLG